MKLMINKTIALILLPTASCISGCLGGGASGESSGPINIAPTSTAPDYSKGFTNVNDGINNVLLWKNGGSKGGSYKVTPADDLQVVFSKDADDIASLYIASTADSSLLGRDTEALTKNNGVATNYGDFQGYDFRDTADEQEDSHATIIFGEYGYFGSAHIDSKDGSFVHDVAFIDGTVTSPVRLPTTGIGSYKGTALAQIETRYSDNSLRTYRVIGDQEVTVDFGKAEVQTNATFRLTTGQKQMGALQSIGDLQNSNFNGVLTGDIFKIPVDGGISGAILGTKASEINGIFYASNSETPSGEIRSVALVGGFITQDPSRK